MSVRTAQDARTRTALRMSPDAVPASAVTRVARPASPAVAGAQPLAARLPGRARRLLPHLSRRAEYLGRSGVVGIALLLFSVVFYLSATLPLRQQLVELQADLARSSEQAQAPVPAEAAPVAQLRSFVAALPARSELPAVTEQVVEQASAAGLALERGSYDLTVTHSGRLVRARLSFPVQGGYPNIRRFIEGTLAALPAAAVDGLTLERDAIGAPQVTAEVRFAVFLRNEP